MSERLKLFRAYWQHKMHCGRCGNKCRTDRCEQGEKLYSAWFESAKEEYDV